MTTFCQFSSFINILAKILKYKESFNSNLFSQNRLSDLAHIWELKALATIPYFNFHFFSTLADIFAVYRPLCTKLIHQSSPAEMAYLVQESQIFAVWINFFAGHKLIQESVSRSKSCKFWFLNFSGELDHF